MMTSYHGAACCLLLYALVLTQSFSGARDSTGEQSVLVRALRNLYGTELPPPYPVHRGTTLSSEMERSWVEELCSNTATGKGWLSCCRPRNVKHLYNVMIENGKMVFFTGKETDENRLNKDGSVNNKLQSLPDIPSVVRRQTTKFKLPVEQRKENFSPQLHCKSYFNGTLHVSGLQTVQNLFHMVNDNLLRMMSQIVLDVYLAPDLLLAPRALLVGFQGRDSEALPHLQLLHTAIPSSFTVQSAEGMCFRRVLWGGGGWLVYIHALGRLRLESADLLREIVLLGHHPPNPFSTRTTSSSSSSSSNRRRSTTSRSNSSISSSNDNNAGVRRSIANTNSSSSYTAFDSNSASAPQQLSVRRQLQPAKERAAATGARPINNKNSRNSRNSKNTMSAAAKKRAEMMASFRDARPATAGTAAASKDNSDSKLAVTQAGKVLVTPNCAHCSYIPQWRCPVHLSERTPPSRLVDIASSITNAVGSLLFSGATDNNDNASYNNSASNNDNTAAVDPSAVQCQLQPHGNRPLNIVIFTRGNTGIGRSIAKESMLRDALRKLGANAEICCDFKSGTVKLSQQLGYAVHADVIVGLHGAGLMNAVFARRGVITVELKTQYGYALDLFALVTVEARLGTLAEINIRSYGRPGGHKPVDAALVRRVLSALVFILEQRQRDTTSSSSNNNNNNKQINLIDNNADSLPSQLMSDIPGGSNSKGDRALFPHPAAVAFATQSLAATTTVKYSSTNNSSAGNNDVVRGKLPERGFAWDQWGHILGPQGREQAMRNHCQQLQPFQRYWEAIKANRKEYCKPCSA